MEADVRPIVKEMVLKVHVIGARRSRLRFKAMGWVFRLAGLVGGVKSIELLSDDDNVIRAGTAAATKIDKVLLDGKEVPKVVACLPGAFGWVEYYATDENDRILIDDGNKARIERRNGNVSVVYRDD